MKRIFFRLILLTGLLELFAACRSLKPAALPEPVPVPATFTGKDGSENAGKKSWRQFFTDPLLQKLIDTVLIRNPDCSVSLSRASICYRPGVRPFRC